MTAREKKIVLDMIKEADKYVDEAYKTHGIESEIHQHMLARWGAMVKMAEALGVDY